MIKTPFFLSSGQLAGGVILGVALWLRHDNQTSSLLILQFEGQQAPGTFYVSEYAPPAARIHNHCSGKTCLSGASLAETSHASQGFFFYSGLYFPASHS